MTRFLPRSLKGQLILLILVGLLLRKRLASCSS